MTTPKKFSPYSTPIQYPSQAPDYISLDSGGAFKNANKNNFKMQKQQYKNNNKQQHYNDRSFGSPQYNNYNRKNYSYSNNHNDSWHGTNKHSNKKQFNNQQRNTNSNKEYDFSSYFHPSMLQDPWQNLMKRFESLSDSKINIKDSTDE